MKIICIDNANKQTVPVFFLKPDTVLLRNNLPFFYPEFTNDLRANVSLVLRISRLGRSISERFAGRYFDAIGIGIDLLANDLLLDCLARQLPCEPAHCFDYSFPISSEFIDTSKIDDKQNIDFFLQLHGEKIIASNSRTMPFTFEQIIAHVSKFITLKIGDYICVNAPIPAVSLKTGDELVACIGEKKMLNVMIK